MWTMEKVYLHKLGTSYTTVQIAISLEGQALIWGGTLWFSFLKRELYFSGLYLIVQDFYSFCNYCPTGQDKSNFAALHCLQYGKLKSTQGYSHLCDICALYRQTGQQIPHLMLYAWTYVSSSQMVCQDLKMNHRSLVGGLPGYQQWVLETLRHQVLRRVTSKLQSGFSRKTKLHQLVP